MKTEQKLHINLVDPENWDKSILKGISIKVDGDPVADQYTYCTMEELPDNLKDIWHTILDMFREEGTKANWIASNALIIRDCVEKKVTKTDEEGKEYEDTEYEDTDTLTCRVHVTTSFLTEKDLSIKLTPEEHPGALDFFKATTDAQFWINRAKK